jgi:thymidylate synthase
MIEELEKFGHNIYGQSVGEAWISLVESILRNGRESYDEGRKRLALMNVRVKSGTQIFEDEIIKKYSDVEKCKAMIDFTFSKDLITDIDVVKSFKKTAKSYHQRIKEGRLAEFVVKRLSMIPESKKAIIVFPEKEDYAKIFKDHYENDYLPCIISIQFRLVPTSSGYTLNTTFYARSIDAYQKSHGNMLSIVKLSGEIAEKLAKNLKKKIKLGFLDGFIADAHIYQETIDSAKDAVERYKRDR